MGPAQRETAMTVASILKNKGREIFTVTADEPVTTAIAVLCAKRIGAVVVLDDKGSIAGIFSERDVIHAMNTHGKAVFDKRVGDLMTRNVVTCTPAEPIAGIMGMMTAQRFRHVPVVEEGRMIGVISIGDVVKSRIAEAQAEVDALRQYIAL
ncbi:Inosine-5-monophosphate dehydrogenase [uncultured Defluviicoccus sp.]|nr:Inosine-5-monophosphate dehydrogenase [uncultured Defluviicoccus sp.]SUS07549.1 Inosine-5-monophosphate dehydrogenase [uncultured Defluviicoccus sp.]